jgi:hypothetical protein
VSQADPPCSVAGIATTLDATTSRLGAAADHAYAAALTQEANAATENLDESVSGFRMARDILRAAQVTRRVFASDTAGLVGLARRENVDSLAAATHDKGPARIHSSLASCAGPCRPVRPRADRLAARPIVYRRPVRCVNAGS